MQPVRLRVLLLRTPCGTPPFGEGNAARAMLTASYPTHFTPAIHRAKKPTPMLHGVENGVKYSLATYKFVI